MSKLGELTSKLQIGTIIATTPMKKLALWASAVCGVFLLIVVLAVGGWSHGRFNRISICTSCHEIFVDVAEYQPAGPLSESVEDFKPVKAFDPGSFNVTVGCAECHAYPFEEYRESAHYDNDRDVRPGCLGCHNPHSVREILTWKFFYVNEGTIGESPFHSISNSLRDIPTWESLRIELATKARKQMMAENSAKCKTCHKTESKWFAKIKRHQQRGEKTCIQCHFNLVHKDVPWAKE
ncbi:MAG: NapC/NirT family cytochrome c [Alphaproteobacteria bacterium]|jgi:nitrate/TMAO reductase-like tetraheme cytochrome c subunit|nr:NapC/NirT family cytochrome c [Alphaproteobacteria bacterium]